MPAKASVGERWKRIDRAFHRGEEFPPVSLYKIGHSYFVLDGNHRVSVARYHGVETIDVEVTELHALLPRKRRDRGDSIDHPRHEHAPRDGSKRNRRRTRCGIQT